MISFVGTYFDGKSSQGKNVMVTYDGLLLHVKSDDGSVNTRVSAEHIKISPPLGKTARFITLPNGATFETTNFSAINNLEQKTHRNAGLRLVHVLESRWRIAIISAALLGITIGLFAFFGIPYLAKFVAYRISPDTMQKVSIETLAWLDKNFFIPSDLPREKAERLHALFSETAHHLDKTTLYRLEFRKGPRIGPNALSLPSGTIVILDELVQIAEDDREIAAIMAHEVSHVKHRHALRQVIQTAGILFMLSLLTGDLTSAASITSALPAILVQSGYSRRFELEADRDAGLYLIEQSWGTQPYRNILSRMTDEHKQSAGIKILSTHPDMEKRLRFLENLEKESLTRR